MDTRTLVRHLSVTTLLFLLATFSSGQTLKVLHTFQLTDGEFPYGGLVHGSDGNFYGITSGGGTFGGGTVFKITPSGRLTTIHSFAGGTSDGTTPQSSAIRDGAGNLYGTTYFGGASNAGTVYKITSAGHESLLYSFTGGADGSGPMADLVRDSHGNLYGTTVNGGDLTCLLTGCGVVFKITPKGKETVLHTFEGGLDGDGPFGGLVIDSAGNLYGTTEGGGLYGAGELFKIDPAGTKTDLHDFNPATDGNSPRTDLAFGPGNILYGTTYLGGDLSICLGYGCGVVFKMDTLGNETVLHSFEGAPSDGNLASGPVARDSAGNLYGVTADGGAHDSGTIYKIDTSGNESILYSFTNGSDGGDPGGRLFVAANGTIYGTAVISGNFTGYGLVFKLIP